MLIDGGWYSDLDIMKPIPGLDIAALAEYASSKGIRLMLWTSSGVLDDNLEKACEYYSSLGISGFKVDFFDAQDQLTVQQVYRFAETCAKYHLVLDLHGIYKPTGLVRTWPNVLNFEAVFGMEQVKWSPLEKADMLTYDVTFPYIRMATGPVDYTPGAMRNASRDNYQPVRDCPMSQGTRAHQVAEYVVFDSPLAMLCDSPSDYRIEEETTRFISSIPTVFERTEILSGKVGQYITTARKKGDNWFIGGLTGREARTMTVELSDILGSGQYTARIFRDAPSSGTVATDYETETIKVSASSVLNFNLSEGGGFAVIIEPEPYDDL